MNKMLSTGITNGDFKSEYYESKEREEIINTLIYGEILRKDLDAITSVPFDKNKMLTFPKNGVMLYFKNDKISKDNNSKSNIAIETYPEICRSDYVDENLVSLDKYNENRNNEIKIPEILVSLNTYNRVIGYLISNMSNLKTISDKYFLRAIMCNPVYNIYISDVKSYCILPLLNHIKKIYGSADITNFPALLRDDMELVKTLDIDKKYVIERLNRISDIVNNKCEEYKKLINKSRCYIDKMSAIVLEELNYDKYDKKYKIKENFTSMICFFLYSKRIKIVLNSIEEYIAYIIAFKEHLNSIITEFEIYKIVKCNKKLYSLYFTFDMKNGFSQLSGELEKGITFEIHKFKKGDICCVVQ